MKKFTEVKGKLSPIPIKNFGLFTLEKDVVSFSLLEYILIFCGCRVLLYELFFYDKKWIILISVFTNVIWMK